MFVLYFCEGFVVAIHNLICGFELQVSHCEDTIHSLKQKLSDKQKEVGELHAVL